MEQLSIWDGEEVNTKSMRDVRPFKEIAPTSAAAPTFLCDILYQ